MTSTPSVNGLYKNDSGLPGVRVDEASGWVSVTDERVLSIGETAMLRNMDVMTKNQTLILERMTALEMQVSSLSLSSRTGIARGSDSHQRSELLFEEAAEAVPEHDPEYLLEDVSEEAVPAEPEEPLAEAFPDPDEPVEEMVEEEGPPASPLAQPAIDSSRPLLFLSERPPSPEPFPVPGENTGFLASSLAARGAYFRLIRSFEVLVPIFTDFIRDSSFKIKLKSGAGTGMCSMAFVAAARSRLAVETPHGLVAQALAELDETLASELYVLLSRDYDTQLQTLIEGCKRAIEMKGGPAKVRAKKELRKLQKGGLPRTVAA